MSEPIKIVVTAQTAEAAAALRAFLGQTNNGLRSIADQAVATGAHMGGMMYQFRSAMDAVRFAAMDGGPRAAFYAIDEGLRAVVASGLKLSAVVPPLAAVAAVVGSGAYIWHQYANAEADAAAETKKAVDELDKIPDLLEKIQLLSKAGLLSPAGAKQMSDEVSGRKPLFVGPDGKVTTQPTGQYEVSEYMNGTFAPVQTGSHFETRPNQAASQEQKDAYNASKIDEISPKIAQALADFRDMEKELGKITAEGSTALDKQLADVNARYDAMALKLKNKAQEAASPLTPEGVRDASVGTDLAKDLATLEADRQRDILKAKQEAQDKADKQAQEDARKAAEAEAAVKEFYANAAKDALKQTEKQITAEQDQAGNQRGELIQQEYNARVQTAKDALAIGGITEEEYSNLVEEAAHKRSEAEKEYNAQLERTAQLKKEIAQAEAEAQLRGIDRNPLLTNQQRAQQSMPLWQSELSANQADVAAQQGIMNANPAGSQAALEAQAKKNELLAQQADLQEKINAAQNADNISYQMDVEIAKLQNVGTVAQQTAAAFGAAWTEAVNSISTNLSKVIQGTESWHRALINIYNAVLNEIVTSIVKMAVQWILQHTLMAAFSSAWNAIEAGKFAAMTQTKVATHAAGEGQMTIFTMLGSLARQGWHLAETIFHGLMVAMRVAAHIAGEVLSTAITLANAILRAGYYLITAIIGAMSAEAQIPYVGPILAVVAAAAIAAAGAAAMGGFDAGGYTGAGPVDEVAGVVHRGEFVIPASAVSRVGVGNLESIRNGSFRSMDSVSPAASSAANKTSVYTFMDPRQMADHLEKNDDHEKYIVDVMRRNIHRFRS